MKDEIIYIEPKYLTVLPKYANAVTSLSKKEDDELGYDVKTTKEIRVPLFISQYSNIILDGHHRNKKALKYKIHKVPCIIKYFKTKLEEYAFVAKINLLSMQSNTDFAFLNVGTGITTSVKELAYLMIKLSGKSLELLYDELPQGDVKESQADVTLAKKLIGWTYETNLENGLKNFFF